MSRGVALSISIFALVACGASSHPGDDDDIAGGSDGDADSDPVGEGEGEGGGAEAGEELDLGPDARPSDYPEADDWIDTDPSALGDGDPCCDLVGDPIVLDGPEDGGGPPVVAWNGAGWGVAWGGTTFRSLGRLGEPIGPVVHIRGGGGVQALEWGTGQYGAASSQVVMLDADGTVLAGPTRFGGEEVEQQDIARYAHGHGWVLVGNVEDDFGRGDIQASWADDDAAVDGDPRFVGTGFGARVVGLRSRGSVAWLQGDGVWHRSFAWPDVEDGAAPQQIIEMLTTEDSYIEAAAYRDLTAVAAMDGGDVRVVLVDPWIDEIVAGPNAVAASPISDRRPGIASVNERGYLGVCYEAGNGPYGGGGTEEDGVSFVLVGPDATAWGDEVAVVQHLRNIGGCAVGWSGDEFLVAWWEAALDDNRILVQRVVARI